MSSKKKSVLDSFPQDFIDMSDIDEMMEEYPMTEEKAQQTMEMEADRILRAKAAKKKQADQMNDMRDCNYYAVAVFANQVDQQKFMAALTDIDDIDGAFIDGYQLAAKMGINIPMTASLPEPHYIKQMKVKNKK